MKRADMFAGWEYFYMLVALTVCLSCTWIVSRLLPTGMRRQLPHSAHRQRGYFFLSRLRPERGKQRRGDVHDCQGCAHQTMVGLSSSSFSSFSSSSSFFFILVEGGGSGGLRFKPFRTRHFSGYSSISFNEAARDVFTFFVAMDLFI